LPGAVVVVVVGVVVEVGAATKVVVAVTGLSVQGWYTLMSSRETLTGSH